MSTMQKVAKKLNLKNFSGREALWIAILFHLIILMLPQSINPFALFWRDFVPAQPEPIKFTVKQPEQPIEEPQSEITEQPEEQKAITPEKSPYPPETDQPTVRGETNLKALESPPQQQQVQPQRSIPPPRDTGPRKTERERIVPREQETIQNQQAQERSQKLAEALKDMPNLKPSEFPITYNNRKPSSADFLDNVVQFDTYDWNYEPYRDRMLRKLYYYWVPKLRSISYFRLMYPGRSVFRFIIRKDGSLATVQLIDPATNKPYDLAAEHAIVSPFFGLATPFPKLPLGFPKDTLGVTVGFFVNMDIPEKRRESDDNQ